MISQKPWSHESLTSSLAKVVAKALEGKSTPVVTRYDIGLLIFERISRIDNVDSVQELTKVYSRLVEEGILTPHRSFPRNCVFSVFGRTKSPPEDIACAVDPFAYLSHLGAMEFHGLTDRIPNIIYLSSPPSREWQKHAKDRMNSDLGGKLDDYLAYGLPSLTKLSFDSIFKRPVQFVRSTHLGAFRVIKERTLRVATIGRTFLDMVRAPELCGKMGHVLDVYQEYANRYLRLIIDEIETHGAPIDKVRVGYILEERCEVSDPRIEQWRSAVQRGGSRRLDPTEDYSPNYSERWCLSLNVPIAESK